MHLAKPRKNIKQVSYINNVQEERKAHRCNTFATLFHPREAGGLLFDGHYKLLLVINGLRAARGWAERVGKLGGSENSVRHNSRFRAVSVQMAVAVRERITKPP